MGIFDGLTAGIEEYKKSGKIGVTVKEGFAGAVSGLTFGIVDQETISAGFDKIGDFAVKTVDGLKNAASVGFETKELTNLGVAKFEELTGLTVPQESYRSKRCSRKRIIFCRRRFQQTHWFINTNQSN